MTTMYSTEHLRFEYDRVTVAEIEALDIVRMPLDDRSYTVISSKLANSDDQYELTVYPLTGDDRQTGLIIRTGSAPIMRLAQIVDTRTNEVL